VLLVDPATVRVVTLGSEEFLELETARRGKKRLFYTTRPGDTLARVGRRYGLSTGDLARINRFSYNTELHDGQRIVVYSPTAAPVRETTAGRTPEPVKRPAASPVRPTVAAAGAGAKKASGAAAAATSSPRTPAAASVRMMPPARAVATSKTTPSTAAAGNKKK
jgi:LysM repeat protein